MRMLFESSGLKNKAFIGCQIKVWSVDVGDVGVQRRLDSGSLTKLHKRLDSEPLTKLCKKVEF